MKKISMGKIILSLLVIFSFFIFYKNVEANTINNISMDIYIDNYGNANVTEIWECNTTSGTEVYHPYYNLKNSKITDLSVSESGKNYEYTNFWNTSGTLNSKAYRCGINRLSDGVELCWGISNYGSHKYTVKYTITNFVSELSDSQMIYWTLIPQNFSNSIKDVNIKIRSDFKIPDSIDVWGYGKYGGIAYVYDGNIEFNSETTLKSSEYMTILVKFPLGTFNASNKLDNEFEYYYNRAEEGSTKYIDNHSSNLNSLFDIFFPFIFYLYVIFWITKSLIYQNSSSLGAKPERKIVITSQEKRNVRKAPYYSDIPSDDILRVYYIASQYGLNKNKTDLLGAMLLKWIKENKIRLEKRVSSSMFKSEEVVFVLNNNIEINEPLEKDLFNMIYTASHDGVLEGNEFKKWCKKHNDKILS